MANTAVDILRARQTDLEAIEAIVANWPTVESWHVRTRPVISQHFPDQVEAFDKITKIRWHALPRVYYEGGGHEAANARAADAERAANKKKVENAKAQLLAYLDAIIELQSTTGPITPLSQESDALFGEIDAILTASPIPQQFKMVIRQDLADAQQAYHGGAFKACVVMLGAALEAVSNDSSGLSLCCGRNWV
jgi:hypothetical protein